MAPRSRPCSLPCSLCHCAAMLRSYLRWPYAAMLCMLLCCVRTLTLGASERSRGSSSESETVLYQMGCSVRSITSVSSLAPARETLTYELG